MKSPSPANRFRAVPCEHFPNTVCLRLPRRSGELSTCVLRAARWRCQCWRGHSRLIDRRWWRAGCSRLRTKWLAGRRAENFLRCAGRENGAFRRRWFLRGGGARKKAAGTSKKCAWSRSERQPFCGGLALNDWRAEAARRAASVQCARVCPLCAHMLAATGICGALQDGFQAGSESMRSLSSASLGASMSPANVPHLFCALRHVIL